MSKEEEYYNQFKNYYLSNLEIANILKSNNEKDLNNNKWSEELLYAIPKSNFIEKWETLFGYNDICKTMKLNEDIKIIDEQKDKIIELLVKNKGLQLSIKDFDVGDLHNSLFQSKDNKDVFPYSDFYLVTKNVWDSFDKKNELLNFGKIKVRKGYRKIVINHDDKYFTVFFLEKNKKGIDPNIILKKNLNKIVIYDEKNANEWIEDVIRLDIYDWFKIIESPKKGVNDDNKYIYKEKALYIDMKYLKNPSFGKYSAIQKKESEISKSDNKDIIKLLNEIEINSIMVKKIRNTTFIIASMYSLSQIEGLFKYFNNINKIKVFNELSDLLTLFRIYLYNLWKKNDEEEEFIPMDFMKELNKQDKNRFGFEKEKEPKVFLEYIIQEFNKQLNDKDEELKKEIDNSKKILPGDKNFSKFYEAYIKKHNSIMSKLFYGIFSIKNECNSCGKYEEYEDFNHINLDINKYINSRSQDSSLIEYYFDDLIDFYFNVDRNLKNEANDGKCLKCKQNNNIAMKDQKTIIIFPEILIFSIDWGEFDPNCMREEN